MLLHWAVKRIFNPKFREHILGLRISQSKQKSVRNSGPRLNCSKTSPGFTLSSMLSCLTPVGFDLRVLPFSVGINLESSFTSLVSFQPCQTS